MKQKLAQTQYALHDFIRRRWSPRAFADRPVPRTDLLCILEAARWAPSSANEQPWNFVLATKENRADYERLFSCLLPGNQFWAGQAPVLMLSVARLVFEEDQSPNRHALHDVGLAVENLIVQAMALDVFVHLGYLGDPDTLPEKLRAWELAARTRKPLTEFIYTGRWGKPFPI